jgi:hypothetical protein
MATSPQTLMREPQLQVTQYGSYQGALHHATLLSHDTRPRVAVCVQHEARLARCTIEIPVQRAPYHAREDVTQKAHRSS